VSNSRRRSTWAILGPFALGGLLLSGGFILWLEWATARAWNELGKKAELLVTEECLRTSPRVLLRPALWPGNAWEDEQAALDAAGKLQFQEWNVLFRYLEQDDPDLRGEVKSILSFQGRVLELASRGTRRSDLEHVDLRRRLEKEGAHVTSVAAVKLSHILLCDGRLAAERGAARTTLDRIGDALQFGRDWAERDPNVYFQAVQRVREQVGHLLSAGRLGPSDLEELGRLLEALDAAPPDPDVVCRRDLASCAVLIRRQGFRGMLQERLGIGKHNVPSPGIRSLFSDRREGLAYFGLLQEAAQNARGSGRWTGAEEEAYWNDLESRAGLAARFGYSRHPASVLRSAQAHLRLARAALQWSRTGERPALDDPFGTVLHSTIDDRGLTAWSNAWNLVDDAGGRKDIVIRVRRRAP
jgi:hypothetical protein